MALHLDPTSRVSHIAHDFTVNIRAVFHPFLPARYRGVSPKNKVVNSYIYAWRKRAISEPNHVTVSDLDQVMSKDD